METNFGHESNTKEFKTSFIVSAGDHQEDQRFIVFKAACAMMNSDGGEIYIGVDDRSGDAVRSNNYGVRGDRAKLHLKNNDAYVRHINQRIDTYFYDAPYVHSIMQAEETDCEDVIRISVKKADRVVFMHRLDERDRIAFQRQGPSSVRMDKSMILQRKENLKEETVKRNAALKAESTRAILRDAIVLRRVVVLHGYSSSNSDSKEDRTVEPIALICDGRSLWAYEEKNEGNDPLRQFRLNRIEYVEVLEDECVHDRSYKDAHVDAFEWSRATEPEIELAIILGPAAKNHLVESSPEAIKYLTDNGYGQWLLATCVHSLKPVVNFCQEFKESITVYAPDELKNQLGIITEDDSESAVGDTRETTPQKFPADTLRGFWRMLAKVTNALSKAITRRIERMSEECRHNDCVEPASILPFVSQN